MRLFLSSVIAIAAALSGCVSVSNLSASGATPPTQAESVIVLGVKKNFRVGLQKGVVDGSTWNQDTISVLQSNTFPERGYIVLKLAPQAGGTRYGIAQILPEGIGGFVPRYLPCRGQSVVTFQASPGKVAYVGDVDFTLSAGKLSFEYSFDAEAARRHMREAYGPLAPLIVEAEAQVLTMGTDTCQVKSVEIPVLIRRR
jgi:hypothetical protein